MQRWGPRSVPPAPLNQKSFQAHCQLPGRQHRDGSFFREGSVSLGGGSIGAFGGGGRLFSREGSAYREGSAQPDNPAARHARGGAAGERSRLGQAPAEQVTVHNHMTNPIQNPLSCPRRHARPGARRAGNNGDFIMIPNAKPAAAP